MSQDLFAAFNPRAEDGRQPGIVPALGEGNDDTGDDDFGEFEDASRSAASPPIHKQASASPSPLPFQPKTGQAEGPGTGSHPFAGRMDLLFDADGDDYDAGADDLQDLSKNPEAAMAFSKQMIAHHQAASPAEPLPGRTQSKRDSNVLFDAEDLSDDSVDNDWGDFEAASPAPGGIGTLSTSLDLLGLDNEAPTAATVHPPTRNRISKDSRSAGVGAGAGDVQDEVWDDFEESVPVATTRNPHHHVAAAPAAVTASPGPQASRPPINIPPPNILLSLFPPLIAAAQEALFDPLAKLGAKERQTLLAHPATHQFLQKYIDLAVVLGRLIAGRRLRWKRDQLLAQSTRIGPSAAGGKGGMKLAGIDKQEATKEDREVLDVVRLWRAQAGRLRSAVASASPPSATSFSKLAPVPEIAEQIPVQVLKPLQGGITAPHACALCGLKREERAIKVDVQVDDSFGEWWLEQLNMHLICRTFWDEYKGRLKSR